MNKEFLKNQIESNIEDSVIGLRSLDVDLLEEKDLKEIISKSLILRTLIFDSRKG